MTKTADSDAVAQPGIARPAGAGSAEQADLERLQQLRIEAWMLYSEDRQIQSLPQASTLDEHQRRKVRRKELLARSLHIQTQLDAEFRPDPRQLRLLRHDVELAELLDTEPARIAAEERAHVERLAATRARQAEDQRWLDEQAAAPRAQQLAGEKATRAKRERANAEQTSKVTEWRVDR